MKLSELREKFKDDGKPQAFSVKPGAFARMTREGYFCSNRHWFRDPGKAGIGKVRKTCVRCGALNPKVKQMLVERYWCMPSKYTFSMPPVMALLDRYEVGDGWADPFAGESRVAQYRNDILWGVDAGQFLASLLSVSLNGILLDPPYSIRQAREAYKQEWTYDSTAIKDLIASILIPGARCISFGWNSNGLGQQRGFFKEEILLVAHGGNHNDTICTVEQKCP